MSIDRPHQNTSSQNLLWQSASLVRSVTIVVFLLGFVILVVTFHAGLLLSGLVLLTGIASGWTYSSALLNAHRLSVTRGFALCATYGLVFGFVWSLLAVLDRAPFFADFGAWTALLFSAYEAIAHILIGTLAVAGLTGLLWPIARRADNSS